MHFPNPVKNLAPLLAENPAPQATQQFEPSVGIPVPVSFGDILKNLIEPSVEPAQFPEPNPKNATEQEPSESRDFTIAGDSVEDEVEGTDQKYATAAKKTHHDKSELEASESDGNRDEEPGQPMHAVPILTSVQPNTQSEKVKVSTSSVSGTTPFPNTSATHNRTSKSSEVPINQLSAAPHQPIAAALESNLPDSAMTKTTIAPSISKHPTSFPAGLEAQAEPAKSNVAPPALGSLATRMPETALHTTKAFEKSHSNLVAPSAALEQTIPQSKLTPNTPLANVQVENGNKLSSAVLWTNNGTAAEPWQTHSPKNAEPLQKFAAQKHNVQQPLLTAPEAPPTTEAASQSKLHEPLTKMGSRIVGEGKATALQDLAHLQRPSFEHQLNPISNATSSTSPQPPGQKAAIIKQIVTFAPHQVGQQTEMLLQPEELGSVRMSLRTGEQGLVLIISAERGETGDLLKRYAHELMKDFAEIGYKNISFSFSEHQSQKPPAPTPDALEQETSAEFVSSSEISGSPQPLRILEPGTRLDIRL